MSSTNTPQINLYKPTPGTKEPASIAGLNGNADIIDGKFHGSTGHGHSGAVGDAPPIGTSGIAAGAVTAAKIASEVWTTFTPTLTQGVALTVTVDYAAYLLIGKTALVQLRLTVSSAGTANNAIVLGGLPAAIAPKRTGSFRLCGTGAYFKTGVADYGGMSIEASTSSTLKMLAFNTADYFGGTNGGAGGVTAASTDVLAMDLSYEVA